MIIFGICKKNSLQIIPKPSEMEREKMLTPDTIFTISKNYLKPA